MRERKYTKSVLILSIGTLLSQAIGVLISPILARIFDPYSFGMFAVYTSVVSTLIPLMSGKYDVAAVSQKSKIQSIILFQVAEIITIIFAITVAIVLAIVYFQGYSIATNYIMVLIAVPAGLLLGSFFSINFNRLTALGDFKEISKQKVYLETLVNVAAITLGISGVKNGMVYGAILGGVILLSVIGIKAGTKYLIIMFRVSRGKIFTVKKYISYLKYNATTAVLDGLTVAMPTFYISQIYGAKETGYFFLATKIINAPTSFISSSIAQVNLRYVAELKNDNKKIMPFVIYQSIAMLIFSASLILLWYLMGGPIIEIVFGREWIMATQLTMIMILSLPAKFLASTLSTILGATGSNRAAAFWRVTTFSSMCIFIFYVPINVPLVTFIQLLVIFEVLAYVFYYSIIVYSVLSVARR